MTEGEVSEETATEDKLDTNERDPTTKAETMEVANGDQTASSGT